MESGSQLKERLIKDPEFGAISSMVYIKATLHQTLKSEQIISLMALYSRHTQKLRMMNTIMYHIKRKEKAYI